MVTAATIVVTDGDERLAGEVFASPRIVFASCEQYGRSG
jgi:hypothetical protein